MISDDDIQRALQSLPDYLEVAQIGVDMATQREYLAYAAATSAEDCSQEAIDRYRHSLFATDTPAEEKKKVLVLLAHTGQITATRVIEQFLSTGDATLQGWATLALQECQMLADTIWAGDEAIGIIMTGLGGEAHRLRYCFVVRTVNRAMMTSSERAWVAQDFAAVCEQLDSVIEDIQIRPTHAILMVLIPMDVAVATVIESGIDRCNQNRPFLDSDYFVTNVKIPDDAEIQAWLANNLGG